MWYKLAKITQYIYKDKFFKIINLLKNPQNYLKDPIKLNKFKIKINDDIINKLQNIENIIEQQEDILSNLLIKIIIDEIYSFINNPLILIDELIEFLNKYDFEKIEQNKQIISQFINKYLSPKQHTIFYNLILHEYPKLFITTQNIETKLYNILHKFQIKKINRTSEDIIKKIKMIYQGFYQQIFIELYQHLKEQNRNDLIQKYFSIITGKPENDKLALLKDVLTKEQLQEITEINLENIYQQAEQLYIEKSTKQNYHTAKKIPYVNDEENIVYTFSDNYTIRRISLGNNIIEGIKMDNCLKWAKYICYLDNLKYLYYSLRNELNMPLVTFNIDTNKKLIQARAFGDNEFTIKKSWYDKINEFLKSPQCATDLQLLPYKIKVYNIIKEQLQQLSQTQNIFEIKHFVDNLNNIKFVTINNIQIPVDQLIKNSIYIDYININYEQILKQLKQNNRKIIPVIFINFLLKNILMDSKMTPKNKIEEIQFLVDNNYIFYVDPNQLEEIFDLSFDLFYKLVINKKIPIDKVILGKLCRKLRMLYENNNIDEKQLIQIVENFNLKLNLDCLLLPLPAVLYLFKTKKLSNKLTLREIIDYMEYNSIQFTDDYYEFFELFIDKFVDTEYFKIYLFNDLISIKKLNSNIYNKLFDKYFKNIIETTPTNELLKHFNIPYTIITMIKNNK